MQNSTRCSVHGKVSYYAYNKDVLLSSLDIKWAYAARDIDEVDINELEIIFNDQE